MAEVNPLPDTPQVRALRKLGNTDAEIADVLACDKAIDRGANLFPLDLTLEVGAKKARRADRTDTPKKAVRTEDGAKRFLMSQLSATVDRFSGGTLEIINPEREIVFVYNGTKYKVVLSAPRS